MEPEAKLDEFGLIAKYFAPLSGDESFGLKDDAALISPPENHQLVITQDAIAAGVHFFADDLASLVAKKALRVNISDLIAKGAHPHSFSLALGLGSDCDEDWVASFAKGLAEDCAKYNIVLSGGDTFKTGGGAVISITAIGYVPEGNYTSRLGAKVGDSLYVTGTIGDAALGLLVRQGKLANIEADEREQLTDSYLLPKPPLEAIPLIREFATASMDISDGLVADCNKLCAASGVSASIKLDNVPLSKFAACIITADSKYLESALTGGDDYQILFSVSENDEETVFEEAKKLGVSVTKLGSLSEREQGVSLVDPDGNTIVFGKTGYNHFGDSA